MRTAPFPTYSPSMAGSPAVRDYAAGRENTAGAAYSHAARATATATASPVASRSTEPVVSTISARGTLFGRPAAASMGTCTTAVHGQDHPPRVVASKSAIADGAGHVHAVRRSAAAEGMDVADADGPAASQFENHAVLSRSIGALFNSAVLSDVAIEVVEFAGQPPPYFRAPAHRVVLAGWSAAWRLLLGLVDGQALAARPPVVQLSGFGVATVMKVLEFCYRGHISVSIPHPPTVKVERSIEAVELLALAKQLEMGELGKFCEGLVLDTLSPATACLIYQAAEDRGCRRLSRQTRSALT